MSERGAEEDCGGQKGVDVALETEKLFESEPGGFQSAGNLHSICGLHASQRGTQDELHCPT